MRHPRLRRNLALIVAGLGAAAMLAAFALTRTHRAGTREVLLGVLGLKATIAGAVLATVYHVRVVRRYERLRRGEGVLVRWRVNGARWRIFQDMAATLAQAPGALPNELTLPKEIPADGIDVLVSGEAMLLGPHFELVEKNAVVRLSGPVLEIEQRIPINRFQTRRAVYRLPFTDGAEADVARLAQCFTGQAKASRSTVKKFAWMALAAVVAILIGIVVWAMSVARLG
jgi:hypothetical protein